MQIIKFLILTNYKLTIIIFSLFELLHDKITTLKVGIRMSSLLCQKHEGLQMYVYDHF